MHGYTKNDHKKQISKIFAVLLWVYIHTMQLKNTRDHGGNQTYDIWNARKCSAPTELRDERVGSSMWYFKSECSSFTAI